ncbi:MAG: 50S ribosomal protein L6 [Magnetococcales bacterium]|nr:50S ribosomal protein L6 [Magnetococcales bacterium]
MSRVGKKPVPLPSGVEVRIDNHTVTVKGKLGQLTQTFSDGVAIKQEGHDLTVALLREDRQGRALWGLTRSLLHNMVTGVTTGFTKKMEINGVGYRAAVEGRVLKLTLGYSHPVNFMLPAGISVTVEKNTSLTLSGIDRQLLGQTCADIRKYRPPEPYKGKGIRLADEVIHRKEGKKK